MKDIPIVALKWASAIFHFNLSYSNQLNYQDFDTEMWMSFSIIQIRGTEVKAYRYWCWLERTCFHLHMRLVR